MVPYTPRWIPCSQHEPLKGTLASTVPPPRRLPRPHCHPHGGLEAPPLALEVLSCGGPGGVAFSSRASQLPMLPPPASWAPAPPSPHRSHCCPALYKGALYARNPCQAPEPREWGACVRHGGWGCGRKPGPLWLSRLPGAAACLAVRARVPGRVRMRCLGARPQGQEWGQSPGVPGKRPEGSFTDTQLLGCSVEGPCVCQRWPSLPPSWPWVSGQDTGGILGGDVPVGHPGHCREVSSVPSLCLVCARMSPE